MREFDLLQHVYAANRALRSRSGRVRIPPGDDLAMLRLQGNDLLAGVDQLIVGRHADPGTPPHLLGRKAVARSLSDIAAMAATPAATLVAVTLPPGFGEEAAIQLFRAMRATADEFDCPLIGGDIAFHESDAHPLICSVTVLAEPGSSAPITRGGARPGDHIFVTGMLGGSRDSDGGGPHLTFKPRIEEARSLAAQLGSDLHAMIDLSDGLGRDAAHMAEQSGVIIELDASRIPARPGLDWRRAVGDGEDYELCFAVAPSAPVPERLGNLPMTRIGRVMHQDSDELPRCTVLDADHRIDASTLGWQHES